MSARVVRVAGLLAAVALLVPFGMPSSESSDSLDRFPAQRIVTSRFALGLPFSPWFTRTTHDERTDRPDGGWSHTRTERGQVVWLSWSWVLVGGTAAGVTAFRKFRPTALRRDDVDRCQPAAPPPDIRNAR